MRRKSRSERNQLELFRALPGDLAPRDAQDMMAYPFFSLAKSKRVVPIDFRAGAISIRVEAVPEHGMATIWDADQKSAGFLRTDRAVFLAVHKPRDLRARLQAFRAMRNGRASTVGRCSSVDLRVDGAAA